MCISPVCTCGQDGKPKEGDRPKKDNPRERAVSSDAAAGVSGETDVVKVPKHKYGLLMGYNGREYRGMQINPGNSKPPSGHTYISLQLSNSD